MLLQGLRCTLAGKGEHVGKLMFDTKTCSLAVKMDEVSVTLPKWNHERTELGCANRRGKVIESNTLFWEYL